MEKNKFYKTHRTSSNWFGVTVMVLWCAFTVAAIGWIILASFSTTKDIFAGSLFGSGIHLENYLTVIEKHNNLL